MSGISLNDFHPTYFPSVALPLERFSHSSPQAAPSFSLFASDFAVPAALASPRSASAAFRARRPARRSRGRRARGCGWLRRGRGAARRTCAAAGRGGAEPRPRVGPPAALPPPQRPVPAGAGLPPPSAPGGGAEGPALRVGPAGLGEFPRWGAEPGLGDGGGAVRRFNSSFDFGACVALRSQVSQRRGASELGQAAGSSPSRPSFLHGALLRFGVLPTLSGCPVPEKKKVSFLP